MACKYILIASEKSPKPPFDSIVSVETPIQSLSKFSLIFLLEVQSAERVVFLDFSLCQLTNLLSKVRKATPPGNQTIGLVEGVAAPDINPPFCAGSVLKVGFGAGSVAHPPAANSVLCSEYPRYCMQLQPDT